MVMSTPVVSGGLHEEVAHGTSRKTNVESVLGRKRMRGGRSNGFLVFGTLLIFLLVFSMQGTMVEGKRGCANFGHSCYGGMGKRANGRNVEYVSQEGNSIEGEVDPAFVFTGPRSMLGQKVFQQRQQFLEDKMAAGNKMAKLIDYGIRGASNEHFLKQFLKLYHNIQQQRDQPDLNEQ